MTPPTERDAARQLVLALVVHSALEQPVLALAELAEQEHIEAGRTVAAEGRAVDPTEDDIVDRLAVLQVLLLQLAIADLRNLLLTEGDAVEAPVSMIELSDLICLLNAADKITTRIGGTNNCDELRDHLAHLVKCGTSVQLGELRMALESLQINARLIRTGCKLKVAVTNKKT